MAEKVCVMTDVGPGTGTALARRFAPDGYKVAHQHQSGWTFELDLRPFSENW